MLGKVITFYFTVFSVHQAVCFTFSRIFFIYIIIWWWFILCAQYKTTGVWVLDRRVNMFDCYYENTQKKNKTMFEGLFIFHKWYSVANDRNEKTLNWTFCWWLSNEMLTFSLWCEFDTNFEYKPIFGERKKWFYVSIMDFCFILYFIGCCALCTLKTTVYIIYLL